MEAYWTIVVAALAAVNCSLTGTYLMLRRMSMMGDAIAHSVLPGIVIAFLLSGSKDSLVVLVGAGSMGILATSTIAFLHRTIKLQSDAAIGINFTWFFALGVILLSFFSKKIDLDPDCILYGEIAYTSLDTWTSPGGIDLGPKAVYILAMMLLANLGFIALSYKELLVTTFDPFFSTSIGMNTALWHYLLMAATSLTTVTTFESVGVVLVVALLVAPPATAYLLTRRLRDVLMISSIIGVLIAIGGYCLAIRVNGSMAGAMATMAGCLFLLTFLTQHWRLSDKRPRHSPMGVNQGTGLPYRGIC